MATRRKPPIRTTLIATPITPTPTQPLRSIMLAVVTGAVTRRIAGLPLIGAVIRSAVIAATRTMAIAATAVMVGITATTAIITVIEAIMAVTMAIIMATEVFIMVTAAITAITASPAALEPRHLRLTREGFNPLVVVRGRFHSPVGMPGVPPCAEALLVVTAAEWVVVTAAGTDKRRRDF